MYQRPSIVLIIVMLLLSQAAIAQHDIEHQSAFEHSEQCAAFVSADQAAKADLLIVELPISTATVEQAGDLAALRLAEPASPYSSRAPPIIS